MIRVLAILIISSTVLTGMGWSQAVLAHNVYLVRHFEKHTSIDGQKINDPRLTQAGERRALNLAGMLQSQSIKHVFSTNYRRTVQSAMPTVLKQGLGVTFYDPRALDEFAVLLASLDADALVVGHSNTTPYLLEALTGAQITLSESDYGDIYRVRFDRDGQFVDLKTGIIKP